MYQFATIEIYLDILFFLNLFMDYFIFWMVSKIMYKKTSRKRLLLGSSIASVFYCLVLILPCLRTINIFLYLVLLPILPINIVFKPKNIKEFIQIFVISNIVALIVGGMTYGILYWVKGQNLIISTYKKMYNKISVWILLFSILASYLMIQAFRYYIQRRNISIEKFYSVEIKYGDKSVIVTALLDTGNKVYDPITKYPVIIVQYDVLRELLPQGVIKLYDEKEENIASIVCESSKYKLASKIRLIPYKSLGNPNGMLLGFKADEVYLSGDDIEEKHIDNVIIAIYGYNLSEEYDYNALLHGDFIN